MHERPELHERILKWCARQKEAPLAVECEQRLPALGLEVLNVLGLIEDEVFPLLSLEC